MIHEGHEEHECSFHLVKGTIRATTFLLLSFVFFVDRNVAAAKKERIMAIERATLPTLEAKVDDFLAQRGIAVAGVSAARETTGNLLYRKLKAAGYQVSRESDYRDL